MFNIIFNEFFENPQKAPKKSKINELNSFGDKCLLLFNKITTLL